MMVPVLSVVTNLGADVGINMVAAFLTDFVYDGYQKARGAKKNNSRLRKEFQTALEEFVSAYDGVVADSSAFLRYLKQPQVTDVLRDYFGYMAMKRRDGMDRGQVIGFLTKSAVENCKEGIIRIQGEEVRDFFEKLFALVDEKLYSKLSHGQKYMLASLEERLDNLEGMLKDCLNKEVVVNSGNYQNIFSRYMSILKKNNQVSFVYGYSDLRLNSFYVAPKLLENEENSRSLARFVDRNSDDAGVMEWTDIFSREYMVYLVGGPGFGKSVFLKNAVINTDKLTVPECRNYLVILCDLKEFCKDEFRNKSVMEFLRQGMLSATGMSENELSEKFLEYYLKAGRCIILLDALDEVPRQYRDKVHTLITGFFTSYNPYNKICITSRDRGFLPKQDIKVYKIKPVDEKEVEQYLDCMIKLGYFKKESKGPFLLQARPLIRKGFLNNFLTLSLLVKIFRSENSLPNTKIELYDKCFSYIAVKREEEKNEIVHKFNWRNVSKFLMDSTFADISKLAAPNNRSMTEKEIIEELLPVYTVKFGTEIGAQNAIEEFLSFCMERTELLVPASEDRTYRFYHRSFFEYFYAKYLIRLKKPSAIWNKLKEFDKDSEIFELVIALVKKEDSHRYQSLVEYVFDVVERNFQNKRVQEFPLFALGNMMTVIDDEAYIQRFYQIFINYSDILQNKKYWDGLNLAASFLISNILTNPEKEDEFWNSYSEMLICGRLEEWLPQTYSWNEMEKELVNLFSDTIIGEPLELGLMAFSCTKTRRYRLKLKESLIEHLQNPDFVEEKFYLMTTAAHLLLERLPQMDVDEYPLNPSARKPGTEKEPK